MRRGRARALAGLLALAAAAGASSETLVERGEYVFHAAGCKGCHTAEDGAPLAGGLALVTPFGTFYSPNITPDPEHGIGRWSEPDLVDALARGVGPGGVHYYPAFPFPSYAGMRREDASALWAYLSSREPVAQPNREHDLVWFARFRFGNRVWKWLFFEEGAYRDDPSRGASWNRGAYLARALTHCGECHTPRNLFGALDGARYLAGNPQGPDDSAIPNITQDRDDGIGKWSRGDLIDYFTLGLEPDGDVAGGLMAEVIDESLSKLNPPDLDALIEYLQSVPPLPSKE